MCTTSQQQSVDCIRRKLVPDRILNHFQLLNTSELITGTLCITSNMGNCTSCAADFTHSGLKKKRRKPNRKEQERLYTALMNGHVGTVKKLIGRGVDVNSPIHHDAGITSCIVETTTALSIAVEYNDLHIARILIENGADVNKISIGRYMHWDEGALHSAVRNGYYDMVRLLLSAGASTNTHSEEGLTPLMYAAQYKDPALIADMFDILLLHGADVNMTARNRHHFCTLLHVAVTNEWLPNSCLQKLIDFGSDVDARDSAGRTPLMDALCARRNISTNYFTREARLTPNIYPNAPNHWPQIVRSTIFDHVLFLLGPSARADPTICDMNGNNSLHYAIAHHSGFSGASGSPDTAMELLLNAMGEDLERPNLLGHTLLWTSVIHGNASAAISLVQRGADVDCKISVHNIAQSGNSLLLGHQSNGRMYFNRENLVILPQNANVILPQSIHGAVNGPSDDFLLPVEVAVLNRRSRIAYSLLEAGCHVRRNFIQELESSLSHESSTVLSTRDWFRLSHSGQSLLAAVRNAANRPRTLKPLCRRAIRRVLMETVQSRSHEKPAARSQPITQPAALSRDSTETAERTSFGDSMHRKNMTIDKTDRITEKGELACTAEHLEKESYKTTVSKPRESRDLTQMKNCTKKRRYLSGSVLKPGGRAVGSLPLPTSIKNYLEFRSAHSVRRNKNVFKCEQNTLHVGHHACNKQAAVSLVPDTLGHSLNLSPDAENQSSSVRSGPVDRESICYRSPGDSSGGSIDSAKRESSHQTTGQTSVPVASPSAIPTRNPKCQ